MAGMHSNPCKSLQESKNRNLKNVLTAHIIVSSVGGQAPTRMQPTQPTAIAAKWGIGLEMARRTLEFITQRALWTVLHSSLSRRFRMNEQLLQHRRLRHDFSVILCLPEPSPIVAKSMPRYLSQSLDGHVCFQWIRGV